MKCNQFRDLAELLRDGALGAAEAREARDHVSGCPACAAFEEDAAVLVAPFRGLPTGPYLPPVPPGRLPPWAGGPVLGVFLALLIVGGGAAWARRGTPESPGSAAVPAPVPARAEARPAAAASPSPGPAGGIATGLVGRVVSRPGGKPVPGVEMLIDGVPVATTDAHGVFRVHHLAPEGTRHLRLVPPGGTPTEALLPHLSPGQVHTLADLPVGSPGAATIRVVRMDARPAEGVVVRGCRLAPTVHPDGLPAWKAGSRGAVLPPFASRTTDASGTAEFESLPPGRWTFQAEREGAPYSLPVDVEVGEDPHAGAEILIEDSVVLEGRVLDDATGGPIPGATVRWSRIGASTVLDDVRHRVSALSGPDGRFRFPAAPAAPLFLDAQAPAAPLRTGGIAVDAARVQTVDIRLPATRTLAGTCVEAGTGVPAAGVVVRVRASVPSGASALHVVSYATTGDDGRFEVEGLPVTGIVQVGAQACSSWCAAGGPDMPVDPAEPCLLEVERAWSVEGVVLDAAGRPAPARIVAAYAVRMREGDFPGIVGIVGRTLADAEGRFRIDGLPPGTAAAFAPAPGDLRSPALLEEARTALESADPPPFVIGSGDASGRPVTVRVRAPDPGTSTSASGGTGRTLRGRTLDGTGAPVPGARLLLLEGDLSFNVRHPEPNPFLWAPPGTALPVAPDGSFEARLPDGNPGGQPLQAFTLVAFSVHHPPAWAVVRMEGKDAVDGVEVRFDEGWSIEGRVLREDGTPAAGAPLEALPQQDARPNGNAVMVRARSGEDGAFRIDGLRKSPHTLVVGRGPGPVHRVAGVLPGRDPVEVRLPPGGGDRAKPPSIARNWTPSPLPGSTSTVEGRIDGPWDPGTSVHVADAGFAGVSILWTSPDETGRFSCRVPPGRRFSLAADLGGGRWIYADDVPSGATDAVLRSDGRGTGTLRGRVVTAAGSPAAGVPVHAVLLREPGTAAGTAVVLLEGRSWSNGGTVHAMVPRRVRTTLTGSDGSFDLGSPAGRWAVFAGHPGSGEPAPGAAVPWSAEGRPPLEIPLSPGRVLRVRGVDDEAPPDAAAPAWAEVRLGGFLPGGQGVVLAVRIPPGPGGVFEFRGLPPGPVTVLLLDGNRREVGRAAAVPGEDGAPPVAIPLRR